MTEGAHLHDADIEQLMSMLAPGAEQAVFLEAAQELVEGGVSEREQILAFEEFERPIMPIRQWIEDEQMVGMLARDLFPVWKRDLIEFFEGDYWMALFTGCLGSGKCLVEGTLVPTTAGVLPIERIVSGGPGPLVVTHTNQRSAIGTTHVIGTHPTIRISTKFGYEIEGRDDHRVIVLDGVDLTWRRLGDIRSGDLVALQRGTEMWGDGSLSPGEAEALGIFVGDGWFGGKSGRLNTVQVAVGLNDDGWFFEAVGVLQHFGHVSTKKVSTCRVLTIHDWRLAERWGSYGCLAEKWTPFRHGRKGVWSSKKRVPLPVLQGSRDVVTAFLRGLFDTDGTVVKGQIEFATTSQRLGYEVQVLLLNLGIAASRSFKANSHQGCWTVRILHHVGRQRFASEIGFRHPKKNARMVDALSRPRLTRLHANEDATLHGMMAPLSAIWENLPASVRKNTYNIRYGHQQVTVPVARKWVAALRSSGQEVPRTLAAIVDRDYLIFPVETAEVKSGRCYDLSVPGDESYVAAGFVSHNTTAAMIGFMRCLYELSCYRAPARSLGQSVNSPIYLANLSVSGKQARRAAYSTLDGLVSQSPYFREVFAPEKDIKSELRFPKRITVFPGTGSESSILGLNVVGGLLDEANLMAISTTGQAAERSAKQGLSSFDQAQTLFNAMVRRAKTRFLSYGRLPVKIFVVSSRVYPGEFTDRLEQDAIGDPGIFVRGYSLWDVKPDQYSKKVFRVELATPETRSRVLTQDTDMSTVVGKIVEIPDDFYRDFLKDPDGSLREFAGIAVGAVEETYFKLKEKLFAAVEVDERTHGIRNPATVESLVRGLGNMAVGSLRREELVRIDETGRPRPRFYPDAPRVVHLDSGQTQDAFGVVMGCAPSTKTVLRRMEDGKEIAEQAPNIFYDLAIRVVPPENSEVDFAAVREILYQLRDWGYKIEMVTMDSWQTLEMHQQLKAKGFKTGDLSIDIDEGPYAVLKAAFYDDRVGLYRYWYALTELSHLVRNPKRKPPIDHQATMLDKDGRTLRGSKDVSDGLAGVAWTLTERARRGLAPPSPSAGQMVEQKPQLGYEESEYEWLLGRKAGEG